MCDLVREQAAFMKKPARTFEQLLAGLAKNVPEFVSSVRRYLPAK
jgi:hypothetical protein